MKKKYYFPVFILGAILFFSLYILSRETNVKEIPVKNISVITRGKLSESWENFKQGAEQAGTDLNANIRMISLGNEESSKLEEQIELLEREVNSDADAIVIAPVDHEKMAESLAKMKRNIPVILVESSVDSRQQYEIIACDNKKMGSALAEEVMRHGNLRKKILLIGGDISCSSVLDREEAFRNTMKISYNKILEWDEADYSSETILSYLKSNNVDVIVAFDTEILENAAKALKEYEDQYPPQLTELYGVGSSSKVIRYLENDNIVSIVVQDDYSMGYLGVRDAINAINGKVEKEKTEIAFKIVDHEHMYSEENQRLLFPFVR
ncbi:substrate-binding domain-containing protein [uncultured Robinsoniella sp.]|uniref:substrate-binding domain-containing protein n=1 Tax=uncultured Robinsoniella sp. TaxID=904190 RepID=UPI00374EB29C